LIGQPIKKFHRCRQSILPEEIGSNKLHLVSYLPKSKCAWAWKRWTWALKTGPPEEGVTLWRRP